VSLALANDGSPRIAYRSNANILAYTSCEIATSCDEAADWVVNVEIEESFFNSEDTSIQLDSSGNPRISYFKSNTGDLKFASCEISSNCDLKSEWNLYAIEESGSVGSDTSMMIDSNGNYHISYGTNSGSPVDLKYAYCPIVTGCTAGSNWKISTIAASNFITDVQTDLVLDSTNDPYVVASLSGDLVFSQSKFIDVLQIAPSINQKNVLASSDIQVVFDEAVSFATLSQANLPIYAPELVSGVYSLSTTNIANDTVVFTPTNDFRTGEDVEFIVTQNVLSISGYALNVPFSGSFSIASTDGTTSFSAQAALVAQIPVMNQSADFDNDGDVDIASIGGGTPGELEVYLNNGNGTFAAAVVTSSQANPRALTLGDFNADGFVDIIASHNGSAVIGVFLNNGSGQFPTRVDYSTGGNSQGIASADFDGDGDLDVVVPRYSSNNLIILENNGAGVFTSGDVLSSISPLHVSTADLDNDGDMDIVTGATSAASVQVFMNQGEGAFAPIVIYSGTTTNYFQVKTADLTGDGFPEIVATDNGSNVISIFTNDGDGTFSGPTDIASSKTEGLDLSDIDADGDVDILAVNNGNETLSLFLNSGTGIMTFDSTLSLGSNPTGISSGDFNGDGALDFTVGNANDNTISVYFNVLPKLEILSTTPLKNAVDVSQSSTIEVVFDDSLNTGTLTSSNFRVRGSQTGLLTGILVFSTTTVLNDTVTFTPNTSFRVGERIRFAMTTTVQSLGGLTLINPYSGEFIVGATDGSGTFDPVLNLSGTSPVEALGGDIDNDGDLDLVSVGFGSVSVYINNGTGIFAPVVEYSTSGNLRAMELADIDNDTDLDVIVSNFASSTVLVLINNGSGVFAAAVPYIVGSSPLGVDAADFDGDGDIDISVSNFSDDTIGILLNNGNGTFPAQVTYIVSDEPRMLKIMILMGMVILILRT
jgi:hypothetical protein